MKVALAAMRRSVRKRAEFDINDVSGRGACASFSLVGGPCAVCCS